MKALRIYVYRSPLFEGCSNGGISEKYNELLLVHERGNIEIDENNPPENLVKLVVRNFGDGEYKHIEPVASTAPGNVGWMSGGAYASGSDSRFYEISKYPLGIHDRQETQADYDRYSR